MHERLVRSEAAVPAGRLEEPDFGKNLEFLRHEKSISAQDSQKTFKNKATKGNKTHSSALVEVDVAILRGKKISKSKDLLFYKKYCYLVFFKAWCVNGVRADSTRDAFLTSSLSLTAASSMVRSVRKMPRYGTVP